MTISIKLAIKLIHASKPLDNYVAYPLRMSVISFVAGKELEKGLANEFKSKVAEHVFQDEHLLTKDNISILRNVSSSWKLDVAECLEIHKERAASLLYKDQGNGQSRLFKCIPKRSARDRNT